VAAAGPIREVITNPIISKIFGAPVRVCCRGGKWELTLSKSTGKAAF
jgi:hypothetical protein